MNESIFIKPEATIREAMQALSDASERILLVVDDNRKLLGTLTDGDVRRGILGGDDLSGTIESMYNPDPVSIQQDQFDNETVKKLLLENRIELIPIVNNIKKVIDYITWEDLFGLDSLKPKDEKKTLSLPVVIMAGGKGTRLDPFTKVLPKPLVPIGDQPIIELIIDKFRDYGTQDYYLTINHMAKLIKAYFQEKSHPFSIHFIVEDKPLGTAGSLRKLIGKVKGPFFVSNCDIIIETDYFDFYEFHRKNGFDITLVAALKKYNIPYGICEVNKGGDLEKINEKPEYNFLVNTGLYILNESVLDLIPENQLFHITDLIKKVKQNGGRVGAFPVSDNAWIDIGELVEYKKALKTFEL